MSRFLFLVLAFALVPSALLAQNVPPPATDAVPVVAPADGAVPVPAVADVSEGAGVGPIQSLPAEASVGGLPAIPATAPGPVPVPEDPGLVQGSLEGAAGVVDAYRTGGWLAALAAFVSLLTWLSRRKELGGLLDRLPKRVRILVPLVLGALSALLVGLLDPATSALEATGLAFLTGPAAVSLHQGLARSVFGLSSPETKAAAAAAPPGA